MPRIRTIKPEFWQDEKLAPLSPIDRLVFIGLISQADDAGRLVDNVKTLDGLLFPETDDSCGPSLVNLARLGRIIRYRTMSGQRIIQILKWDDHQKVVHPSKHTLPSPQPRDFNQHTEPPGEPHETLARTSRDALASTLDLGPWTNDQPTDNDSSLRSESAQAPDQVITSPQPNGTGPDKPLSLHQQAMPVLRELGYAADKTDGSILKAIKAKGFDWEKLEPAVRGLALLRDDGKLKGPMGLTPGDQLNMRILYARDGPKDGAQPIWRVAENRWYQHLAAENRKNRGKMPSVSDALKRAI